MKRTAIKPGATPMKRSTPLRASKTPLNRAGMNTLRVRHQGEPVQTDVDGEPLYTPLPPPGNQPTIYKRSSLTPKKIPPTAAERRWMAQVAKLGCIVCLRQGRGYVPCAVHHIVEGGRRLGHMHTIGLCDPGHHQKSPDPAQPSRHPDRARFTQAYGSEYELLEYTRALLAAVDESAAVPEVDTATA